MCITNEEKFKAGNIIEYCGDKFIVLENYGHSGKVKEYSSDVVINNFYWSFSGEKCKVIK